MKAEKQIKIARGTAFFLIFSLILVPGLLISDKLEEGESVTWQFALLFMGFAYIWISPLFALCMVFIWSLKRRKQKTALVTFILLVIWMIIESAIELGDLPAVYRIIPIVVVVLLLQGILGLHKSQAVSSPPVPPRIE